MIDVIRELETYGVQVHVHDPVAPAADAEHEYQVTLEGWAQLPKAHAIVAAVSHQQYKELTPAAIAAMTVPGGVFVDVKSIFDPLALAATGLRVWRL